MPKIVLIPVNEIQIFKSVIIREWFNQPIRVKMNPSATTIKMLRQKEKPDSLN